MKKLVILASGDGTNTQQLIDHFRGTGVTISLVISNNPEANVLRRAKKAGIPTLLIDRNSFYSGASVLNRLLDEKPSIIVCAGFLWKVPDNILSAFPDKIINIHPALLPKFGGKGMYGLKVHKAVIDSKEKESGITVHYLNGHYDEGAIIFQAACAVKEGDTPEILAQKVQELEHRHFPKIIEQLIK